MASGLAMLTTNEAADVLRVTPYRIRELIREGRLKASHHPTAYCWQIPAGELKRYIASGRSPRGKMRKVDATKAKGGTR
jgi:excisionase family DNA binding protein